MARIIIGVFIILIGLSALTGFSFWKFGFSLILIAIGILILTRAGWRGRASEPNSASTTSEDSINEVVIFGPLKKIVKSDNFRGGKVVAVFGGGDVDISQVKTSERSVNLEFVVVFGGGKLIIPKGWRVNSQGVAVFGGYNSKVQPGDSDVTLNIKGAAIFGGVEIIN